MNNSMEKKYYIVARIDGDYACPVTRIAERVAKERGIPVVLLCDTNHVLSSDTSEIRVIGAGADAVDIALINLCLKRKSGGFPVCPARANGF